jgi:basic amino acid/polyamine antiporter, APA family
MPQTPGTTDEGLIRAIGPVSLGASVINIVVGATIFVLPAVLVSLVGAGAPVAYLTGAAVMGLVTLSFAEAGRRTTRSGGPYAYVESAFGLFPGYLTGLLTWLAGVLATAAVAAALVDSVSTVAPILVRPAGRTAALLLLFAGLAAINLRGVRAGVRAATAAAVAKFTGLLLFIVLGVHLVEWNHLALAWPADTDGLGRATILVIFALAGMEMPLSAGGEIRDPVRTVPRALLSALLLIALLYIAVQLVAQGILGTELGGSKAPLADALARLGPGGRALMLTTGAVSMLGYLAGDILGNSRILFAFGRDGLLPSALAAVHPRTRVPHVAVLAHVVAGAGLAMTGTFTLLAPMSTVAILLLYAAVCAAAWTLTRRPEQPLARSNRLTTFAPIPAVMALTWVLTHSTAKEFLAVTGVLAVGTAAYWVMTRTRPRSQAGPDAGARS